MNNYGLRHLCLVYVFALGMLSYGLLATTTASAATWKSQVEPAYYVYVKGNTVIANKAPGAYPIHWVLDKFMPRIYTEGVGCDNNKVGPNDFNSTITFNGCDGLKIQEVTTPAANNQWFQDVNMSYIIGDFDNHETIDIGRGHIVASGRSAIGTPRGQTATAEKEAKDTTGNDKYDCDNPNPNRSKDCSLLIYFTNGDKGDFHITLDDNGYKNSIHEYWYDGPVTRDYSTLTFHANGGSVVENNADSQNVLIQHTDQSGNVLREYDSIVTANYFPEPTRDGFAFVGWSTNQDPARNCRTLKDCVTTKLMTKDVDLYAEWTRAIGGYVLTPHVGASIDQVKQGDTVTFTPGVTKDNNTNSNTTSWKFCRLIVAPNETVPAAGSVCSNAKATVVESNNTYVFNGAGPFTIGNPANHAYTVPANTPYGAQICYALLVDSSTQEPGHPAEAVKCVAVAKYPSVHILGGDVKVGDSTFAALVNQNASIQTGSFNVSGRSYGSWAEYGLFAPASGKIISSSGGMLSGANGADAATVNPVSQNGLTFANVTTYGYWAPAGLLTMPTAIASAASANSSVATTQVDVGANVSAASGEVRAWNITAPGGTVNVRGTLPAGSGSVILLYNGTVNINGDIRLGDSTVRSLGNNSQIIIVARNITIGPSVSNVDAWLIATPSTSVSNDGRISTCGAIQTDAYYTGLTLGGECDTTPLRIMGTVVARELQLRRSFAGSGAGSNAMAAETINLRPDAYMWGNTNGGSVNIETSFVKELPPRL